MSGDFEPKPGAEEPPKGNAIAPDSITRNTGFALAEKLSGAFFTAILTLFLVRALGPDGFGTYALALSVGTLVLLPSNLGIGQAASRFVAELRDDRPAVAGVVADALLLKLTVGAVMSIALFALAQPIATAYGADQLTWPLRITAVAVYAQSLMLLCASLFEAVGKVSAYLRVVLAESATEASLAILFVLLGGGATAAILGRAAAYGLASVMGLALVFRLLGRNALPGGGRGGGHVRRIIGYGSALLVVDGAFTLFSRIDALLIGAIISVPAVALFEAPARLVSFLGYVGSAAATGVGPRMALGPEGPDNAAFEGALRYLIVVQGALIAPLLIWAEPLTRLTLGSGYGESADVLRAMAPFAFLLGISPLLAKTVNYLGEARRRVPIVICALLVNVAIDLALLSKIGVVAAAIATDVAYTIYAAAHLWICRRLLGTKLRPLLLTFVRTTLAAGAMGLVLLACGTGEVAVPLLILGGACGLLAYGMMLVALREVDWATVRRVRRNLWAALPWPVR